MQLDKKIEMFDSCRKKKSIICIIIIIAKVAVLPLKAIM